MVSESELQLNISLGSQLPINTFRALPHNGKIYYQLEGTELWLPERQEDRPARKRLERHNDEVFLSS